MFLLKNLKELSAEDKTLALHNANVLYPGNWKIEGETLIGEVSDATASEARKNKHFN